ncbi:MAG: hypothetical protein JXQ89_16235 [Pelagimonas sp.]
MMGRVNAAIAAVLLGQLGPQMAQAGEIWPGCYERVYSDAHLAKHPKQVVKVIRLQVGEWLSDTDRAGKMQVIPANQGHVRGTGLAGQSLSQFLLCSQRGDTPVCQVECDGGSLELTKQDNTSLTFRTRYLMVGDNEECGGVMDLAEVQNQWVKYRLNRVQASACDGM